jgi:rhodanese-related sulfurtransferase
MVDFLERLIRQARRSGPRWIEVEELHAQLHGEARPLVVDVRGPDEFCGPLGHIPAALNLPLSDLPRRMVELEASRHSQVCIVCRTDQRSARAAELLIEGGFVDVVIVRGGMERWRRSGFVIAREADH